MNKKWHIALNVFSAIILVTVFLVTRPCLMVRDNGLSQVHFYGIQVLDVYIGWICFLLLDILLLGLFVYTFFCLTKKKSKILILSVTLSLVIVSVIIYQAGERQNFCSLEYNVPLSENNIYPKYTSVVKVNDGVELKYGPTGATFYLRCSQEAQDILINPIRKEDFVVIVYRKNLIFNNGNKIEMITKSNDGGYLYRTTFQQPWEVTHRDIIFFKTSLSSYK